MVLVLGMLEFGPFGVAVGDVSAMELTPRRPGGTGIRSWSLEVRWRAEHTRVSAERWWAPVAAIAQVHA